LNGAIHNVYFNAEKIINLRKGLPLGAMTWGVGSFHGRSIAALARDLRERFTNREDAWYLERGGYTVKDVAEKVCQFFHGDLYQSSYPIRISGSDGSTIEQHAAFGMIITGYSAGGRLPESWIMEVNGGDGACQLRPLFSEGLWGLEAKGMPDAIQRLVYGYSQSILDGLISSGVDREEATTFLRSNGQVALAHPGMPLQDAVDSSDSWPTPRQVSFSSCRAHPRCTRRSTSR
jgi:hypothetical protein